MKTTRVSVLCALSLFASFGFGLCFAQQGYPSKPIRVIVPYPPGGIIDVVARLAAPKMSAALVQPVLIDNRSGASGVIGSEAVARAAPDGYTILFSTSSTHATNVYLAKNISYDPIKDFVPLVSIDALNFVAVHPSLAVGSAKELIDYARKNPGKLSYGSSGVGSVAHMTGELVKMLADVNMVHVPYKGAMPAISDLLSGQISMVFAALPSVQPHAQAGKMKIIAVVDAKRFAGTPEVAPLTDALPNFRKPPSWLGFFAPAGLPAGLQARLRNEILAALTASDVRGKVEEAGLSVSASTPEQITSMMKGDIELTGKLVKALGLQPE